MTKKFSKVILSIILASTIFTTTPNVLASSITVNMPQTIEERRTVEHISSGVVHEQIQEFTTAGWQNINVLRIDLKDEHTQIKALLNKEGIPLRSKVSTMVNNQNALAGINGDFFNYAPLPSALGTLISEGEMISSPVERAYPLPSFFLNKDNLAKIGYLDRSILMKNYDLKMTLSINTLNKVSQNFDTITMLNNHWGEKSIGNRFHNDLVEVLIVDNLVQDVRINREPFTIPQDGYVLAGRESAGELLIQFKPGQRISLNSSFLLDPEDAHLENIDFAIGGGSVILKNGQITLSEINITGNNPRTGIGINKANTELMLVTIDGRDSSYKGASQEMFGAMLRKLGAYNAINLDGGGSTVMAIKPLGEDKSKLVNKPSEGSERLVVNGVGVFANAPKGELSYLKLSTESDRLFVNTTRNITVKGFDKNHNPVKINPSQIIYTINGVGGNFQGNSFIPNSPGLATIKATLKDVSGELNLQVLNEPKHIYTNIDNIYVDKNERYTLPDIYGKDELGRKARIYPKDIHFEVKGDIGYIKDGQFFGGGDDNSGAITLKAGQGIKNILVSKGLRKEFIHDFENIADYKFSSWPAAVPGSIGLNNDFKDGKNSISLKYDFTEVENTRVTYLNLFPDNSGINIEGTPSKLGLWVKGDGNGAWLRANILDSTNTEHAIDFAKTINWEGWEYVEAILPEDIPYPIALNRIYTAETDNDKRYKGEILIDSLSAYYTDLNENLELPEETTLKDNLNKEMDIVNNGFRFVIGNEPIGIEDFMENNPISEMKDMINKSEISIFLNGTREDFRSDLNNNLILDGSKGYSINKHYDTVFIGLNSSKDGIRAKDANQWIRLKRDLDKRPETNIIITLPTPIFGQNGFNDKLEADLFHETLIQAKDKNKNIFVIHGDSKNYIDLKDGIRYMGLNTNKLTSEEDLYTQNIIEFVANGADISYKAVNVFNR